MHTTATQALFHPGLRTRLPGLLLVFVIAGASAALAAQPWAVGLGLSALTLAIVLGMVIGNTGYTRVQPICAPGVDFAKQRLLRAGIVLFGMRITFQDIGAVGWSGALVDAVMLASTFMLALLVGRRWWGMDARSVLLIGAGSSICGAAAVLATEPVVKARGEDVAVAVATVVVFGTLAMFGYPLLHALAQHWHLSDAAYGLYVGSTVHEVAQVVVAGSAVSEAAAAHAVIAKMIRVMMLAPFLLLLSAFLARGGAAGGRAGGARKITVPWFALSFIAVAGFHSLQWLPSAWVATLVALDNLLLAMAMAALGLSTHVGAIRRAGVRPLLLALVLFCWLIVGGALVNGLLTGWWT